MSTTVDYPTTAQVEAVRQAILAQYAGCMDPTVSPTVAEYGPLYPEPVVIENYTSGGYPAVVWEEGPEDWPFVIAGGTTDAEYAMAAEVAAEFGGKAQTPRPRPAAVLPEGVFVEPVDSISVGVYPA